MIPAPYLEVAVLVLGAIILLVESFASQLDRRFLAYAALCGLGVIFLATFFVAPQSSAVLLHSGIFILPTHSHFFLSELPSPPPRACW